MVSPDNERVIYEINPLTSVVCQLRFPTILKIDSSLPADFQDAVRSQFPLFDTMTVDDIQLPEDAPQAIRQAFASSPNTPKSYKFSSEDRKTVITLTRDFLALETTSYRRWEQFRRLLDIPFEALVKVYQPTFFTRTGLRYQNVIKRSQVGLEDVEWSEIINPPVLGILSDPELGRQSVGTWSQSVLKLNHHDAMVRFQHGIVKEDVSDEICYMLDTDVYRERTKIEETNETLDSFRNDARRLFRWSITDRLHNSLRPQPAT